MLLGLGTPASWRRAVHAPTAIDRDSLVSDLGSFIRFLTCRVVVDYLTLAGTYC